MLKNLSVKLRESLEKLARIGMVDRAAVDELVTDIQRSLLAADVEVKLVFRLSEAIKKRAFDKIPEGITRREHVIKVVYEELARIMGDRKSEITIRPKKILLVGLYGSGKTTTAAKLGRFYQKHGLRVMLVACDTVRPAAHEQLEQLAKKIDADFYGERGEKNSTKILKNALKKKADIIIIDSSGRNALEKELIDEIKLLNDAAKPEEKILVIPADIGQAARQQAAAFHSALGITDVIITKMDATAKGGGALTACHETGAKVKFITVGELPDDIQHYDPQKLVGRILGMPDLETLLEKARAVVDEKKAMKVIKGDFDIEDFYSQIEGVQKMGSLSQVMDMMGMGKLGGKIPGGLEVHESKMKKWKYIIQSMTPAEKANPDMINAPRIRRIAKGSGCSESEVRELISNYSKSRKMIKKINPSKLKRSGMGGLFRQFGM
jgi:signal recognition particle subunit SRP54